MGSSQLSGFMSLETEDQDQAGGGADVELLQCAEENDCSLLVNNDLDLDLDFDSSKEMMIVTLAASVTRCMDILIGRRTIVPFLGSFLTCIINFDADGAMMKNGIRDGDEQRHPEEALDGCLMKNDCVATLDNGLGVDVDKLVSCIGSAASFE
jgi:hypothetical protein